MTFALHHTTIVSMPPAPFRPSGERVRPLSTLLGFASVPFRLAAPHPSTIQRGWPGIAAPPRNAAQPVYRFSSMQDLARRIALNGAAEEPDADAAKILHSLGPAYARLFVITRRPAELIVPTAFRSRVQEMFAAYPGGTARLDFVESQTIVATYNRMTEEYSLFNDVRRYRPGYMEKLSQEEEAQWHRELMRNAGPDTCDFCSESRTAEDVFGRVYGKHCYTASNIAKYERWHSLIISREHHPLNHTSAQWRDYISTAHAWAAKVHERDPTARFPHLMFDAGWRASASQPHMHIQMAMTANRYFTRAEHTRLAAVDYFEGHYAAGPDGEPAEKGHSYWADVVNAHEALGLALRFNRSAVLSYITPIKERELVILTEDSTSPCFGALLAAALTALTDGVGTRSMSMGITLEPYGHPITRRGRRSSAVPYPAIARVVDRGSPMDRRNDVGAMEFYGANNVGADPFHIMPHLIKHVKMLFVDAPTVD